MLYSVIMKARKKLILLIALLLAILYPSWYCINWYAAGLADQVELIEFNMEDDFLYCNKWRPGLLPESAVVKHKNLSVPLISWAASYNKNKTIKTLIKRDYSPNESM